MKFLILSIIAFAVSTQAGAFECKYDNTNETVGLSKINISAKLNGSTLTDIEVFAADTEWSFGTETNGSAQSLAPTAYSRPSKYSNDFYRYDLMNLKNEKGQQYLPGDECVLELHVPKTLTAAFIAPLVIHCDQGGGTARLSCTN
jgi:hypothetical protein